MKVLCKVERICSLYQHRQLSLPDKQQRFDGTKRSDHFVPSNLCLNRSNARRHWTVTVRFIPTCIVQYSLKVHAVVNGPADLLSPPVKLRLTFGAPASLPGLGVEPSQVPLTIICGAVAVSTSVIESPFLMVIVLSMK